MDKPREAIGPVTLLYDASTSAAGIKLNLIEKPDRTLSQPYIEL